MQFLVPYDGSDQARRALELCLKLVKPDQDFVYLLGVISPVRTDPPFGYSPEAAEKIISERKEEAAKHLQPAEDRARTVMGESFEALVEVGDPRTAIVDFVERHNIGMVFMGSRGLSGLTGFFIGSASQYALHNCPCPVTIVK